MAKPIRIYVIEEDGEQQAISDDDLRLAGFASDEEVAQSLSGGTWHELTLHPLTAAVQEDIDRYTLVGNDQVGFRSDSSLYPRARVLAAVKSWTFAPDVSAETFRALPIDVSRVVDTALVARLYKGMGGTQAFLTALKDKQKSSGQTPQA